MDGGRGCQRIEVVAAFQRGYQLTAGMLVRHLQQLFGNPGEIWLGQPDLRQWIPNMGIESGRDENDIWRKIVKRGQDATLEGGAERFAAIGRFQWRIPDIADAGLRERTSAGKQRHLMR